MSIYFVLATEALGPRMWFSGLAEGDFGDDVCLATVFFGALPFETRTDAEACLSDLELSGFEVSECELGGISPNLIPATGTRQ